MSNTTKDFISSIQTASKEKTSAYDSTATVKRIEGGTAWVHIPGGVDETPVKLTIAAHEGDNVQVRVSGGRAFLVGNGSAPPTDDATAVVARTIAVEAQGTANSALEDATRAREAADRAEGEAVRAGEAADRAEGKADDAADAADKANTQATYATNYANNALTQLGTVESVVDTLTWIAEHSAFEPSTDASVMAGKTYYYPCNQILTLTSGTTTINGLTFVTDANAGTVTVSGTATASTVYAVGQPNATAGTDIWFSGVNGGSASTYQLRYSNGPGSTSINSGVGLSAIRSSGNLSINIYVTSGYTANDVVFTPRVSTANEDFDYEIIENPTGNPSTQGYFELNTDDAVKTYVQTHLALTDDGLYVLKDGSAYKVLVANDGMYVQTPNGTTVNQVTANGNIIKASNGTVIANLGYGEGNAIIGSASSKPYYSFGVRKITSVAYNSSSTYAVGDLCVYNDKIYVCTTAITTPEAWNSNHWSLYIGNYSVVEGESNIAGGALSHAEGYETMAIGPVSHAEGYYTQATGDYCHSEGFRTIASGDHAHAEGSETTASGQYSHAEGYGTTASGYLAHTEGSETTASGYDSHAEGYETTASGDDSHAEGYETTASGQYSHAEGYGTTASGNRSHAQNYNTIARGHNSTALGKYNIEDTENEYAVLVGNGTGENARSNALTVDWSGNVNIPAGANYMVNGTPIGGGGGAVSGVKGNAESTYRTGNVNITPANVGAVNLSDKYTRSSAGDLAWTGQTDGDAKVIAKSALAFWNGAYSGNGSNLSKCSTGNIIGSNGGTMTGQLLTSFKSSVAMGSYGTAQTTVDGFVGEVRYSSGCMGSVSINTAYTKNGTTIPTGWYNFIYSPHRSGGNSGAASGDNCNYGTLILSGMTMSAGPFFIQVNGGTIQSVKLISSTGGWVLAGSATGTNTVTIPDSNASEVYVKVNPSGTAVYTSTIMRADLKSVWYVGGYYYSSTDYGIINLNVSNSNKTFQLRNVRQGGADLKSSSTLTVYYR